MVQVAAYPERKTAEQQLRRHQERFAEILFRLDRQPNAPYSIIAGPYDTEALAWRVARRMQSKGITSLVRRYRK
ncbi:SPOR domain-containing protein [candidate division KSB1 bacterium]|nr:SPOR domain-containing protein [candidate division KSB1 bacterium]